MYFTEWTRAMIKGRYSRLIPLLCVALGLLGGANAMSRPPVARAVAPPAPGVIGTAAGDGTACMPTSGAVSCGDGGMATAARLDYPFAVRTLGTSLYIADGGTGNGDGRIRLVDSAGVITTVAGGGNCGAPSCGDSTPATAAELANPVAVAVDGSRNIFIADGPRVREVIGATGAITTILGLVDDQGNPTYGSPGGVAVDGAGALYVDDNTNNLVTRVRYNPADGTPADGRDANGNAISATISAGGNLNAPEGLPVDGAGALYVANTGSRDVLKIADTTGMMPMGNAAVAATIPATDTANSVDDVALDASHNLYIASVAGNTVLEAPVGRTTPFTVAGDGAPCATTTNAANPCGDGGPATQARLNSPPGVALDAANNLYIADQNDQRLRVVGGSPPPPQTATATPGTSTTAPTSPTTQPTATGTATGAPSGTARPTGTQTPLATSTGTSTPQPSATSTGTSTPQPSATSTGMPQPSATTTAQPTGTATGIATPTPTRTATATATGTPTRTATPMATAMASATATSPAALGTGTPTPTSTRTTRTSTASVSGTPTAPRGIATMAPAPTMTQQFCVAGGVETARAHSALAILNPNSRGVRVALTFYPEEGATTTASFTVAASAQRSVALAGLTRLRGTFGLCVAADRAISGQLNLTRPGQDGDSQPGVVDLGDHWYLAEGYTGLTFHEQVSLLNPDARHAARVSLRLLLANGRGNTTVTVTVPAHTNRVVDINRLRPGKALSVVADSDRAILVARTLTFSSDGYGLTTRAATPDPRTRWLFAEGVTRAPFQTFLTVLNPRDRAAMVTVTFFGGDGRRLARRTLRLAPRSRTTLAVNSILPNAGSFATVVTSDRPVVVERSVYAGSPNAHAVAGSDVFGRTGAARRWVVPGSALAAGDSEFLLLCNPSPRALPVTITFYNKVTGGIVTTRVTVPARARYTVDVGAFQRRSRGNRLTASHGEVLQSGSTQAFAVERTVIGANDSTLQSTQGVAQ